MTAQSTVVSVSPSQHWEGNDGNWSTFAITIGSEQDLVRLLPATSQSSTWTVMPGGCPPGAGESPEDCSAMRGVTFDPANSTTFDYNGHESMYISDIFFELPYEAEAPINNAGIYSGSALVGYDNIRLGSEVGDPTLQSQTIACYVDSNPFLGQLGINGQDTHIANFTDAHPSILGSLRESGTVSSTFFAYTAGSFNRSMYGSLTFGGYDAARGNVQDVLQATMSQSSARDLVINIAGIQIGSTSVSMGSDSPLPAFIDSMVPEIWLPSSICDQFESEYGLTWNQASQLYYVNGSQHDFLQTSGPNVTFTLQALGENTNTTQITMPYSSFDQIMTYPLLGLQPGQTFTYFPIKRANSSQQYYLGRTFLQDAYLTVDYDTRQFNVSPALFPELSSQTDFVAIVHPNDNNSDLSAGAIAGIVIGVLAVLAVLAGVITWRVCLRRRRKRRYSMSRTESIGGQTVVEPEHPEYVPSQEQIAENYKPPVPPLVEVSGDHADHAKREELQGSEIPLYRTHRYELSGDITLSDQSRSSVSPLEERRPGVTRQSRQQSDSSFGFPSPQSQPGSPPLELDSPPLMGSSFYPGMERFDPFGRFELHGRSADVPTEPGSPVPDALQTTPLMTSNQPASSPELHSIMESSPPLEHAYAPEVPSATQSAPAAESTSGTRVTTEPHPPEAGSDLGSKS